MAEIKNELVEEQGTMQNEDVKNQSNSNEQVDLTEEVAKLKAQIAKQKATLDKTLKEKGDITKQLRAKQTAEELAEEERKEAEELRRQELEEVKKELAKSKAVKRYMAIGMDEEMAEMSASAELDGDFDAIAANFNKLKQQEIKKAEEEWLKSRPQVNAGMDGKALTKEQFKAMSLEEKSKLYRENQQEYERLNSL